jgi:lipoprotein-anchoring transpeptidase ErfK/SrfK
MTPVSKHRATRRDVRRRGRIGALTLALGTTIVVGAAAVGVLPKPVADTASADAAPTSAVPSSVETATLLPVAGPAVDVSAAKVASDPAVPADSGSGRRIVFDQGDQRVWLVAADGDVERTYPVSGSRHDNLDPGSYTVQSKTRNATAFDYSGTMQYFVHFATGYSQPIGFHTVPRDNAGRLEQTKAQLGTPLSAGCVRQWEPDAIALWEFAPVGTQVVVTP